MDFLKEFYKYPFAWGLLLGLAIAVFIFLNSLKKSLLHKKSIKKLKLEIEDLKKHLYNQMNITSRGTEEINSEINKLRNENENLRKNISVLDTKIGRNELKTLHKYEKAINIMYEKSPGFATAWQVVLKESEDIIKNAEKGIIPLVKKVFTISNGTNTEKDNSNSNNINPSDKSKNS